MERSKAVPMARAYVRLGSAMSPYMIYQTLHKIRCSSVKEFNETNRAKDFTANDVDILGMLAMGEWAAVKEAACCRKVLDHATIYLVHPFIEHMSGTIFSDFVYDAFIEVDGVGFDSVICANNPLTRRILMGLDGDIHTCANFQVKVPILRNIYIVDSGIPQFGCIQMVDVIKPYPRRYIEQTQKSTGTWAKIVVGGFSASIGTNVMHSQSMHRTISMQELLDITNPRDRFFEIKLINIAYSIASAYLEFIKLGIPLMDSIVGKDSLICIRDSITKEE